MTVQTTTGDPTFGPGDFTHVTGSVTWGLKVRCIPNILTGTTDVAVICCTLGSAGWAMEYFPTFTAADLQTKGAAAVLTSEVIPQINSWLATKFASAAAPAPAGTDPMLVFAQALDMDVQALKVITSAAGVPSVST